MMHISIRTAEPDDLPVLVSATVDPLELGLAWGAVLGLTLVRGVLALVRRRGH